MSNLTSIYAEWIPLWVAALSIAGAAATYAYQRRVDRRSALIETRRTAYRNYLHAFIAMTDRAEKDEDVSRNLHKSEIELLIVGSDEVIQRVGDLSRYFFETNHDRFNRDPVKVRMLVASICSAMRADCFEKTDLSIDEIQALVPIA